jgi:hypothetical protein
MKISCPACQRLLSGADINLASNSAVCPGCGEFFSLPSPATAALSPFKQVDALRQYRPADLQLTEASEGTTRVLQLKAPRVGVVYKAFFSLVWCGFLAFWYSTALRGGASRGQWPILLLPLIHVSVGVGMIYGVLGQLLNVTTIRLGRDGLSTRTRPLPRSFAVRTPLASVDGFGVFDATARGSSGTPTPDWQVQLLRADGTSHPLKLGLQSPAHAQFIADVLNAQLTALRADRSGYRG